MVSRSWESSSIEPCARRRKRRGAYGSGGLLTRVALVLAAPLVLPSPVAAQVAIQGDTGSLPMRSQTVAVVPFANISGQASDDWIGAGIAETVTADLERAGVLTVVRREALLEEARRQGAEECPSCAFSMGQEVQHLVDGDKCPECPSGKITQKEPKCTICGFAIRPGEVVWG